VDGARADRRRWWILVPAVPLLVVCLGGTHAAGSNQGTTPHAYAYGLAGLAALTLLLRLRAPLLGLSAAALATGAYLLLDQPYGPILFAGPVWAWCLAAVLPLRRAVPWIAGYGVVLVAAAAPGQLDQDGWGGLLIWSAGITAVLAAGTATGFALAARQRSEVSARQEVARRAVSEERLAMAQDVHDGVGHSLAVIAMQAGVAAHVLDRDPDRARELLATVVATSREALDGLRADLEQLRTPAARRPGPGLADLSVLLNRMRSGGLDLELSLPPPEATVPPDVGAAAYRIVQESLTNVLRHSGAGGASVRVSLNGTLRLEVADRGSARSLVGDGTGIEGMRRRAESVGGWLIAGARVGGGFVVMAELPVESDQAPVQAERPA
jgi:signal transduction histidine kinase